MSDEQLIELEALGAAFTCAQDAAIILEVDVEILNSSLQNPETPEYKAYNKGRLKSEFETRQSIVNQAKAGSSPAQVLAMQLIRTLKMDHVG